MNQLMLSVVIGGLTLTAAAAAKADVHISINPFGWGAPPVVYEPERVYAPPPVVYGGDGYWGGYREGYSRDRHDRHGRRDRGHDRR